jgi:hypothetical protein
MTLEEIRSRLKNNLVIDDAEFDALYPKSFLEISDRHFSSIYVCQLVSKFLSEQKKAKILDIGSGAGKFCLIGALANENNNFTGIEYRATLHQEAVGLKNQFQLTNCQFLNGNILDYQLQDFNAFYMFNPFLEQKDKSAIIAMDFNHENEIDYLDYVLAKLENLPSDTRLATYYIDKKLIPKSFSLIKSQVGNQLHFFIKTS